VTVPFTPGRMDALQEQTDVDSFAALETDRGPASATNLKGQYRIPAEELLVDKAQLLRLTAPEMTVLVGGMRVLEHQLRAYPARRFYQAAGSADERLLREPGSTWARSGRRCRTPGTCLKGRDRKTGAVKWTGTRVDLIFGSNSHSGL